MPKPGRNEKGFDRLESALIQCASQRNPTTYTISYLDLKHYKPCDHNFKHNVSDSIFLQFPVSQIRPVLTCTNNRLASPLNVLWRVRLHAVVQRELALDRDRRLTGLASGGDPGHAAVRGRLAVLPLAPGLPHAV